LSGGDCSAAALQRVAKQDGAAVMYHPHSCSPRVRDLYVAQYYNQFQLCTALCEVETLRKRNAQV